MPNLWVAPGVIQLLLASSLICTLFTAVNPHQSLNRRQPKEGVVTGVGWRDEHGNVAVRREVRDMQVNHPDQWSLYLLALSTLQWSNQSESRSYYGLASIHGRPYRTWENGPGLKDKIGKIGYCPHGNMLFMGWHRPYLALFEEELYKTVQSFTVEAPWDAVERWKSAADSFRMPYWDWAKGSDGGPFPELFMQEMIDVTRPSGERTSIWNPLYAFYFHPLVPEDFESKWIHLNVTQRWPTSDESGSKSNQTQVKGTYDGQKRGLHDHIDLAFRQNTVNKFANKVEEAHGWVHGVIGGGWEGGDTYRGHMWPLEYSAFEPLFMLHHTNVDRLFAMYQAAHPDIYFEGEKIGSTGTVFLEDDAYVDGNTDLVPFRKPSGDFWTLDSVRNTTSLGYAYPETTRSGSESDEEHIKNVNASIATLYGSSARSMLRLKRATAGLDAYANFAEDDRFIDWRIDTKAISNSPSSFVVRFSLSSDFSIDVGSWVKLMHSSHGDHMRKRASTLEKTYEGSVSLTATLLDQQSAGQLASLEAKDVVPFLKDNLHWKVLTGDGTPFPHSQLDTFTFEVVSSEARIPRDTSIAIEYSADVAKHPEVTFNKAGGVMT